MTELAVYTGNSQKIILTGPDKKGGEGAIYSVNGSPEICAKIYYPDKITVELRQKIEAMIKNPPGENLTGHKKTCRSSSIAWPLSLLYDSDRKDAKFLGFTMSRVDTSLFKEAHRYYDPQDRQKYLGGSFSWLYLLTAAFNIAYVVSAIHKKGHRIGDMSASNILVARTAAISIIDCDSFQIDDTQNKKVYYTKVATGDFLPPELMGKNFRDENIERYYSDLFALAIIIFKFLMNGFHPYQARGKAVSQLPTIEQKIMKGHYPHAGVFADVMPPKNSLPYSLIPPALRKLFDRCFIDGHKYREKRPQAAEWAEALRKELSSIRQCSINENHWYPGHLASCPWCTLKSMRADKKDIFPPNQGTKKTATEIRAIKSGFQPAKIFTPISEISPKRVELRPSNTDRQTFDITIENIGDGILTGKINSDREWMIIGNPDFSTPKIVKREIVINKNLLPHRNDGIKFAGNISVISNGGNFRVPVSVSAGNDPSVKLSEEKIIFKNLKKGDIIKTRIEVLNEGNGLLKGHIISQKDWIKVSPGDISTYSRQNIEVAIDTNKADNILNFGKLEIVTNGGNSSLKIAFTLA